MTKFGTGDEVQLIKLPRYTNASDNQPLCTVDKYKNTVGTIVYAGLKTVTVQWQTFQYSSIYKVADKCLKLIKKFNFKSLSTSDKILRLNNVATCINEAYIFTSKGKGAKRTDKVLRLTKEDEAKLPQLTYHSYECGGSLTTLFKDNNRMLFYQTKKIGDDENINPRVASIADRKHFFEQCKKHNMLPSYVTWKGFHKEKKVLFDLSTIASSITLYLYVTILRNVRESPYTVRAAVYLNKVMSVDWITSYLLATVICRNYGYRSFFDLSRSENVLTSWKDVKIHAEKIDVLKDFIERRLDDHFADYHINRSVRYGNGFKVNYNYSNLVRDFRIHYSKTAPKVSEQTISKYLISKGVEINA